MIREDDVLIYGYREPDEIKKSKIRRHDRFKMARMGIKETVIERLGKLEPQMPIWLHLDVDVLDPSVMPVCFPEPNGLSVDDVRQFFSTCFENAKVIGLSIGCYHPNLDPTEEGAKSILDLLSHLLFLPKKLY